MDPQSKRFVWDTIEASFKMDRGAILTTHSMEEADALCTRVGIMVKGELRYKVLLIKTVFIFIVKMSWLNTALEEQVWCWIHAGDKMEDDCSL